MLELILYLTLCGDWQNTFFPGFMPIPIPTIEEQVIIPIPTLKKEKSYVKVDSILKA